MWLSVSSDFEIPFAEVDMTDEAVEKDRIPKM